MKKQAGCSKTVHWIASSTTIARSRAASTNRVFGIALPRWQIREIGSSLPSAAAGVAGVTVRLSVIKYANRDRPACGIFGSTRDFSETCGLVVWLQAPFYVVCNRELQSEGSAWRTTALVLREQRGARDRRSQPPWSCPVCRFDHSTERSLPTWRAADQRVPGAVHIDHGSQGDLDDNRRDGRSCDRRQPILAGRVSNLFDADSSNRRCLERKLAACRWRASSVRSTPR